MNASAHTSNDKPALEITKAGEFVTFKHLPASAPKRVVRFSDLLKDLNELGSVKD